MDFIRLSTWQNKLAPFLGLIYAFFYLNPDLIFEKKVKNLIILLFGIILIAIWASLVNNYYDIDVDTKAGKTNGMAKIQPNYRRLILALSIILGFVYTCFLLKDKLVILFYSLSYICFYLYSSTSIRLKEKPFFDLITDGLGSQLFPTLFIFAFLFNSNFKDNYVFIFSGALWLFFAMGVRALIMHQYDDEEKDRLASLNTYVIGIKNTSRKKIEFSFLIFEIVFFSVFAFSIHWISFFVPFFLYATTFFIIKKKFSNLKIVYFKLKSEGNYRIFMYDSYTIFIFSILCLLCWQNVLNIIFVIFHLLLFHNFFIAKIWRLVRSL